MEETLKSQFERFCADVGMNISTAITIFAKKVVSEQCIPFEVAAKKDDISFMKHSTEAEKCDESKEQKIIEA